MGTILTEALMLTEAIFPIVFCILIGVWYYRAVRPPSLPAAKADSCSNCGASRRREYSRFVRRGGVKEKVPVQFCYRCGRRMDNE